MSLAQVKMVRCQWIKLPEGHVLFFCGCNSFPLPFS